ncbi:MAG: radical SAM family heme chaperone HemW [Lachnospiraceae bacterium]|nr:radical SAM family heme chaperone HemW [Lachnospiraceae bacterium]
MNGRKELELYVHIPFCVRKCRYCDFLSAPASSYTRELYLKRLCRQIRNFRAEEEYEVRSIFIGGGTPSLLSGDEMKILFESIRDHFTLKPDAEITAECNPGTLTPGKLSAYAACGINRLSIGLQSADDEELKLLGRIHTWNEFRANYEAAREAGFHNINIDLMSALPGQTIASWERTLTLTAQLAPEHISAYSLIIEEGTPFYEMYGDSENRRSRGLDQPMLPSEETERKMYWLTRDILSALGMHRYEISNYALPGYECTHNIGYWRRVSYAGFGVGAASLIGSRRYRMTEKLDDYIRGDDSEKDVVLLSVQDEEEETMFLGLRMTEGVSLEEFRRTFGISMYSLYGSTIEKLRILGLIEVTGGRLRLTEKGTDVSNPVLAEFLL